MKKFPKVAKAIAGLRELLPAPPAPPAESPRPHPLDLNPAEARWQGYAVGPERHGWFNFGLHGNPPFNIPVQVVFRVPLANGGSTDVVGVGIRRCTLGPDGKERWECVCQFEDNGPLLYWRFLSPPP